MSVYKIELSLNNLVSDDEYRPNLMGIHNDGEYLVVTNGHALAEIDIRQHEYLKNIGSEREGFPKWKGIVNAKKTTEAITFSIDSLLTPDDKFEASEDEDCEYCSKRGWTRIYCNTSYCNGHDVDCCHCDGTGIVKDDRIQLIKYSDRFFKAELMNKIVSLFKSFDVKKVECVFEGYKMILTSSGIRCFVMGVIRDESLPVQVVINEVNDDE